MWVLKSLDLFRPTGREGGQGNLNREIGNFDLIRIQNRHFASCRHVSIKRAKESRTRKKKSKREFLRAQHIVLFLMLAHIARIWSVYWCKCDVMVSCLWPPDSQVQIRCSELVQLLDIPRDVANVRHSKTLYNNITLTMSMISPISKKTNSLSARVFLDLQA